MVDFVGFIRSIHRLFFFPRCKNEHCVSAPFSSTLSTSEVPRRVLERSFATIPTTYKIRLTSACTYTRNVSRTTKAHTESLVFLVA